MFFLDPSYKISSSKFLIQIVKNGADQKMIYSKGMLQYWFFPLHN